MPREIFEPKPVVQSSLVSFTFNLPTGVTISSAVVSVSVWSGTDPSPSAMISGSASISGSKVSQLLVTGVAGVLYLVHCLATLSDSQILESEGYLAVI